MTSKRMEKEDGSDEEDISFLTDTYDDATDSQNQPKIPSESVKNKQNFYWKNDDKEIELTKAVAMKGISKVCLNKNEFQKVSRHLGKVVSLHLQSRNITTLIPEVLDSFYSLAHLYLYGNQIVKIQGLDGLPQLESLHLYNNCIRRMENLGNCVNLRRLYLGHNEIEVVEGLENLSMLLELHIEDQKLPSEQPLLFCPNSMDTICGKLKVLNISGNQLESIEDVSCMDVLDTLYASRNNLLDLNQTKIILQSLRHLRVVDLRNSPITKDPKYKEQMVGHLQNIEVLDGKDINEMTKRFLQRFSSVKANRMRQGYPTQPIASLSFIRNDNQSPPSLYNIPSSNQSFQNRFPNSQTNLPSHFQFSTPISSSPAPEMHYQSSGMPQEIQGHGFHPPNLSKGPSRAEMEQFYASRSSSNQLDQDEKDPERMSEMAKIIFRLSNLSADEATGKIDNLAKTGDSTYWGSSIGHSATVKEARPLSPLETVGSFNKSSKPLGSRKSAPMRRPMARKLPPRSSVGAGRTLSPLEELPTPDSLTREGHMMGDWIGQALKTSTLVIPTWLKSRKDGTGHSKK